MARADVLNPNPPEFGRFLYASVGGDRRCCAVPVLSVLARLDLDPWTEAADLAALNRKAAATRFALLLSRVGDVPTLDQDHGAVGRELTGLLCEGASPPGNPDSAAKIGLSTRSGAFWAILAGLFLLSQMMLGGSMEMGE